VRERTPVLERPGVAGDRLIIIVPLPRRRSHALIIAVEAAAEKPVVEYTEKKIGPAGRLPRRIADMAEADESLTDGDLQSEIELVGDLVVAASSSDGPLPPDEIDRLLGVAPGDDQADAPASESES